MDPHALYLLSVKENGIPQAAYDKLSRGEKVLLDGRDGRYYLKASERAKFSVVLTGGAFDVLHIGHVLTLSEAKKLGDVLVVIVATDETVQKRKGKKPIHEASYRAAMVFALKPVGVAIVGGADFLATFARVKPDVVAFGYDQKPFPLPDGCKSAHLESVKADPALAKTSRIIRDLGI
ncbi:MAG: adenylyltransferase/cytidyltransferase family protein [Candidatus Micrarchaeota archaeon]|nr:adenylyltransferase/cytidyltransferase family protein [Candidatus Micrarchaeota archaeon]